MWRSPPAPEVPAYVERELCDIDRSHGPATHAAVREATIVFLCEHCACWSPRLAATMTAQGWTTYAIAAVAAHA